MNCTICQCENISLKFTVTREDPYAAAVFKDRSVPAEYGICSRCGCMFQTNAQDFDKAYASGEYYGVDTPTPESYARRFKKIISLPKENSDNVQRVRRIKSFLTKFQMEKNRKKRVLDMGAGLGVFLHEFLEKGWQGTAVEPDPEACVHLHQVLAGTRVHQADTNHLPRDLNKNFDLLTFNRVLEHIENPVLALTKVIPLLVPGGWIYVEVPDVLSFYEDGPGNEAFGHGHYTVHSPGSLALTAQAAGLVLMHLDRVTEPSGKYTLYGFMQKTASFLMPGKENSPCAE